MNEVKKFSVNISYQMLLNISNGIVFFIFTIIAANKLGPGEFGRFSLVQIYTYIISIMSDLGMSNTLVKEVSKDKSKANLYLSNLLGIKLFLSFAAIVVVYIIADVLHYSKTFQFLLLVGTFIVVPQSIVIFVNSIFNSYEKMKFSTLPGIIINIVTYLICSLIILFNMGNLIDVFLIFVFFNFMSAFVSTHLLNKYFFRFKWQIDVNIWRGLIKDSFPFYLISFSGIIGSKIDNVMISKIKDEIQVGYYNVATRITQIFMFFVSACNTVFFPFFSRLEAESKDSHIRVYNTVMKIMSFFGFLVLIYVPLFSKEIISWIFPKYIEAIPALRVLAVFVFSAFMVTVTNTVLYSINKQSIVSIIVIFATLLNIVLNLLFIPIYGIIGASLASVVFGLIQFIFGYLYLTYIYKIKIHYMFVFLKYIIVSLVSICIICGSSCT